MGGRRMGAATVALALAATMSLAAGVGAAGPAGGFHLNHSVGQPSLVGRQSPAGASVKVVHKRGSTVLATRTTTVDQEGEWRAEGLRRSRAGDRFVVTVGGVKRTVSVPDIRLTLDPASDTVSGRVPVSDLDVDLTIRDYVGSLNTADDPADVTAEPDGTFSYSPGFPIEGADEAFLGWVSPAGDDFSLFRVVPSVEVRRGSAFVEGTGAPGSTVTVTLKNASGVTRGTLTSTLDDDQEFDGSLRRNGVKVPVASGDRVFHSGKPGVRLDVRTPDAAIDPTGTGTLTVTCYKNGRAAVARIDPVEGDLLGSTGFAPEADGTVTVADLDSIAGAAEPGDRYMVVCETPAGMAQRMIVTVPTP